MDLSHTGNQRPWQNILDRLTLKGTISPIITLQVPANNITLLEAILQSGIEFTSKLGKQIVERTNRTTVEAPINPLEKTPEELSKIMINETNTTSSENSYTQASMVTANSFSVLEIDEPDNTPIINVTKPKRQCNRKVTNDYLPSKQTPAFKINNPIHVTNKFSNPLYNDPIIRTNKQISCLENIINKTVSHDHIYSLVAYREKLVDNLVKVLDLPPHNNRNVFPNDPYKDNTLVNNLPTIAKPGDLKAEIEKEAWSRIHNRTNTIIQRLQSPFISLLDTPTNDPKNQFINFTDNKTQDIQTADKRAATTRIMTQTQPRQKCQHVYKTEGNNKRYCRRCGHQEGTLGIQTRSCRHFRKSAVTGICLECGAQTRRDLNSVID